MGGAAEKGEEVRAVEGDGHGDSGLRAEERDQEAQIRPETAHVRVAH